jgi:hypothetical protein
LLEKEANAVEMYIVTVLLRHYLLKLSVATQGKLVKFEELPGDTRMGKRSTNEQSPPLRKALAKTQRT